MIIILEGVDKFREASSELESNIKFWLPKWFPSKVKIIVTASKHSQAYEYLQAQGCKTITVKSEEAVLARVIDSYKERSFIMEKQFVDRFFSLLTRRVEEGIREGSLYIKTAIACLCPYETLHIAEFRSLRLDKLKEGISHFDQLTSVATNEDLIQAILLHYENCLMSRTTYRQIIVSLTITSQGLSKLEILSLVARSDGRSTAATMSGA